MKNELKIRAEKIVSTLKEIGADACLLSTSVNIYYVQVAFANYITKLIH